MNTKQFSRLLPTSDGGSRFDELSIKFELTNFAPPAQPLSVSPLTEASECGFLHVPAGWYGEMHPSPSRMWIFVLQGRMRLEASNGDAREISPGSALLLEDVVGCGHVSRVLGEGPVIMAVVRLPGAQVRSHQAPVAESSTSQLAQLVHSDRLLRDYFRAKDENRPHILEEVFADNARLEVVSRPDQIAFPAFTVGREAIADVLVRRFDQVYENIYSFYLRRPEADGPSFSCSWLVAMTEKASRSVRVGCGRYDWTFSADGTRVDSLVITIGQMLNLGSAAAVPMLQWVASLRYPWTDCEEVGRSLPLDQLQPVIEYLRCNERPN